MKILYISKGDHVDYQDDCLCIGLKELFGADVVDVNKRSHIYTSYPQEKARELYGMGMTVTRVLPDLEVDRTDIGSKIKNKYFDLIVYGSIWRCSADIQKVLEHYPKEKVVVVDGEDETNIHPLFNAGIPYFKRELIYNHDRLIPISFAIPTNKLNFGNNKVRDIAICKPGDKSTYIYKTEEDYYGGYNESFFGITTKKAGWDCLRHYEIMGNSCIPLFTDISMCPELTMVDFPKQLCIDALALLKTKTYKEVHEELIQQFETHVINNNTTLKIAEKFINLLKK